MNAATDPCDAGAAKHPEPRLDPGNRFETGIAPDAGKSSGPVRGGTEQEPAEQAPRGIRRKTEAASDTPCASVVDVFCGIGGLSHGFRLEGFEIAAGIDIDERCRHAFEHNNDAPFVRRDVAALDGESVKELFVPARLSVLVGCTPCQPFSVYNQKNRDPQWQLLEEFARIIADVRPSVVSMENVPRLVHFRGGEVFAGFLAALKRLGYRIDWRIAFAPDYGVPQRRARLVLLASQLGEIAFEEPTHAPSGYRTVADTIGELPKLAAGDIDEKDPLHRSSKLSPLNLERIRAAKAGGSWHDWHEEFIAACHKVPTGRGYTSVYGRMEWDAPAPTITTQFFGFGNGRFGHPEQDRGLSLREGAMLQSFPREYSFVESDEQIEFKKLGRMIGNAVPVLLARAIARSVQCHAEEHA